MSHNHNDGKSLNRSINPSFHDILQLRLLRRDALKGAASLAVAGAFPLSMSLTGCATGGLKRTGMLGFSRVPLSMADNVRVPDGYTATVLLSWGDPIGHSSGSPAFKHDAATPQMSRHCRRACTTTACTTFRFRMVTTVR